jgi:hypothetical protein
LDHGFPSSQQATIESDPVKIAYLHMNYQIWGIFLILSVR